ncbi:hypothetical protein K432DRAFT_416785 [Lepidopterella palustris CBS 459.81]|uniref:Uncharacterized protein n=1 Tax=Lepidopterella palustris CBS 459.81 TaxID=1314670 RepID=A0A8E2JFC1_9PEZI|nr:hypothetical protein K432DRAFT_416785 [Lepidopterella palustris CBS 459.81]
MAAVMNALAMGVMGISLIPLGKDFFPGPYKASTVVRVAAGMTMPGESSANTGGNTPGFGLFDGNGGRIGFKSGTRNGKIKDGHYSDIIIDPINNDNNRPPEYISIVGGGSDAICVAYIAITPPSQEYWAFYGDNAKQCGAAWYHSNLEVGLQGNLFKPSCFWIASPGEDGTTSGNFPQGMGIHVIDFTGTQARQQQYTDHPETMCQSTPRFNIYASLTEMNCLPIFNPPLQYAYDWTDPDFTAHPSNKIHQLEQWTGGRFSTPTYGVKRSRRSGKARRTDRHSQACFDHHVIISDYDAHSAEEHCHSYTAVGPEFVSIKEGLYCDMCTGELWPVCSSKIPRGCFDMNTNTMRPGTGPQARDEASGRLVPDKAYKKVTRWK